MTFTSDSRSLVVVQFERLDVICSLRSYLHIVTVYEGYRAIRQLTNSVTRRFGDKAGRFGERLGRFGNTIGRFGDNYTNSVSRRFVNRQHAYIHRSTKKL